MSDVDLTKEPRWKRKIFARNLEKDNRAYSPYEMKLMETKIPTETILKVYRSRDFLVQVHAVDPKDSQGSGAMERLSICRTKVDIETGQWSDRISWEELMMCKDLVGYGDYCAVEIFPPNTKAVNVANFRHLWVFKEGQPSFMWNRKL